MKINTFKEIEYTEVYLSELDKEFRMDAEYFQGHYINYAKAVKSKKHIPVRQFAFVTDGIHASIDFDTESNINLISAKAPKEFRFDLSGTGYISTKQHSQNPRTALKLNDVIISTVGTIGNTSIVTPEVLPANSDRHIGIIRPLKNGEINAHFLTAYLNSKYGKAATMRETAGNVQLNLYIKSIKQLTVPFPSDKFQLEIQKLVEASYKQSIKAEKDYENAENLLYEELNLSTWKPKKSTFKYHTVKFEIEDNHSIINLSSMLKGDRLDAEYWDAACLELLERLSKFETTKLRSEIVIKNGFPFQSKQFIEVGEGEPFIRIRDCKPHFIQTADLTKLDNDYVRKLKVTKANTGDIVIGMDGLKWFYGSLVVEPVYVNQRVCHIQIKPKSQFTPEYILLVINSKIGQMQLLRQMTIADTVGHIKNTDVAGLIIPASKNVKAITKKVKSVQLAEQQSKSLIDVAKKAVEIFIEQDEKEALKFIKQNTK